jgi:hypothetical protein
MIGGDETASNFYLIEKAVKNKIPIVTIWVLLGFMSCVPIGCTPLKAQPSTDIYSDKITFLSRWTQSGKVRLLKGEYREAAAPGSASEIVVRLSDHMVVGQINGKETAAMILTTAPGGSGTFYDLALIIRGPRGVGQHGYGPSGRPGEDSLADHRKRNDCGRLDHPGPG